MPGLPYLWPDDDYVIAAAAGGSPSGVTFTGTADADYPVENIGNEDPSNPFKTTDTSADIDIDLGSAVPIGLIAIVHANLTPGLSPSVLSVLLDDNSGFSSPETFQIDVPDYQEDDFPGTALYDFIEEGDGVKTFRYLRVKVVGNGVGITIGEIIVAAGWRELDADFRAAAVDDEVHPTIENESEAGGVQTVYPQHYRRRWVRGELLLTSKEGTAVTAEPIRRWNRAAQGRGRPFLIHPNLPIDEPWYVRFEKDLTPRARVFQSDDGAFVHSYQIGFEECARGTPPEPIGNL